MRRGDIVIGGLLVLLSVAVWVGAASFEAGTAMVKTFSPAYYPRFVAGTIAFCAILNMLRSYRTPADGIAAEWGNWRKLLHCTVVMTFQLLTFEEAGFFPSTWVSLTLLLWILNVRPVRCILISSGFVLFVYLFFVRLLQLQLPMEFFPAFFGYS